jgi:hypothetical protein
MNDSTVIAKRPAIVIERSEMRLEMKDVDCILIEKEEVINILKTLEGLKRKLQTRLK